jgi:hypothetical protein
MMKTPFRLTLLIALHALLNTPLSSPSLSSRILCTNPVFFAVFFSFPAKTCRDDMGDTVLIAGIIAGAICGTICCVCLIFTGAWGRPRFCCPPRDCKTRAEPNH